MQDEIKLHQLIETFSWGGLFHIQNPEDMYVELVQSFQNKNADTKIGKKY